MTLRVLDLFCGAGGAAMGYHRAGFEVVGIDIDPQPNYPFEFHQQNALSIDTLLTRYRFDAIHASPPCQRYSLLTQGLGNPDDHPDLVAPVRELLRATGLPYIIENVVGAPLEHPLKLCGSSFGLGVWRHRLFETNWPIGMLPPCSHAEHPLPLDVTGTGGPGGRHRKPRSIAQAGAAMGIGWMTRAELSEAIPPMYTEFLGAALLEHIDAQVAA